MFRPWGNVVLIVLAAGMVAAQVRDVRRRRRRGAGGCTPGSRAVVGAMFLLVLSQVATLL